MNFTLKGKLIYGIKVKIAATKQAGQKYDFMEIKRSVFAAFSKEIGENKDLYNKAVCGHFGKLGAKTKKAKHEEANKLIKILNKILMQKPIREDKEFWLQEKIREGKIELSPEGDVLHIEEDESD